MKTTICTLLFCITAHWAVYKTQGIKLSRLVRSPHFTKSDSGDSSIVFRTHNWSGVARGADGARGVFSGAAAAAGNAAPVAGETFSIAASGAESVKDKQEEYFGGSDHSDLHYINFNPASPNFNNPYIPDHHGDGHWGHGGHGHHFHRGFSGHEGDGFNYGQINSRANSQTFAKSEASSNAPNGCDDTVQNGLVKNTQPNPDALSKSQSYSNAAEESSDSTQNTGQLSSNTFSKFERVSKVNLETTLNNGVQKAKSFTNGFSSSQGVENGGGQQIESHGNGFGGSQGYQNSGGQQIENHGNGFGSSQGFQTSGDQQVESNVKGFGSSQGFQNSGGQQVESNGNGFGISQGLKYSDGQQVESHGNGYISSQGLQKGGAKQVGFHGNGFGNSQGLENSGDQRVESLGNGFGSYQGFQNAGGHKVKYQINSNGFSNDQDHKSSYGFDHNSENNYGSHLSKGFELGTGSPNINAESNNNGGVLTGHGQKYSYGKGFGSSKYQGEIQSGRLQGGGVAGQSSDSNGSLTNNSNSNGQESLFSNKGAPGHEDLQSTLSGALDLASQGLQATQNQPCSTCQKSSYAFSNAKSNSGSAIALSIGG